MTRSPEQELDLLIDALNNERMPSPGPDAETLDLLTAARAVKSLRPPAEPGKALGDRIFQTVKTYQATAQARRRPWKLVSAAAVAAVLIFFSFMVTWNNNSDLVYAMEKAVAGLANYHGIMEVRTETEAGEEWPVRRVEIWSEGDKYAVRQPDGTLTVNNGEQRWQVRPQDKEVVLLPLLPDPLREAFDLRDEAKKLKEYPFTVVGVETVSGRQATKLEITPPGGLPYYLWIDRETNLPLRLETPMTNSLKTIYTFVTFEPNIEMDQAVFAFEPPKDYKVIEEDPGQQVASAGEAAAISNFVPILPETPPARIFAFKSRIVFDYGHTVVVQTPARGDFEPNAQSSVGIIGETQLEVIRERFRWQQDGIEIVVEGEQRLELARQMGGKVILPGEELCNMFEPQIQVQVDLEIVKADQRQVDGGHSPWQLDPVYVAMTFVNLQLSPEGITGEPKIPESSFKLASSTGIEACVEVSNGPIKKVYLKRLVRQDETGIWSVVGYDTAE